MNKTKTTVRDITVTAIIHGQFATLIDRHGRPLRRNIDVSRLGRLVDDAPLRERWAWRHAIARMKACVAGRAAASISGCRNPWQRKADNLAKSFYLRSVDHARPRGRCRFEKYSTTTWDAAVKRLVQQGYNRFRYLNRSGWHRWSCTVSNNHNKKMGGRYAKAQYRDGQADLNLIEKQQYRCALSGRKLTPETASLDHVVPLSRGGKHDISNLQVLEHQVNTAKGTLTMDEFISLCEDVIRHTRESLSPTADT